MIVWIFALLPLYLVSSSPYLEATASKCLWHKDSCAEQCPEHLVIKASDCTQSYWSAQRTCKNPEISLVGTVCGFSRCDCPGTTVLDTDTGFCYDVDNCPTKHEK